MDKRIAVTLLIITLLGIALRVLWVVHVPTRQLFDFATFAEIASNIFHGYGHTLNGNPVAWQGPGYSYALAFFHRLAGSDDIFNAKILNVILSSATLVMTGFIYRVWFPYDDLKMCVAYGFTAVFPNLIAYNNVAGTETLFLFLLAALLLARLYIPLGRKQAAVMGLLCGLAAFVKPFMIVYPAVALAMWWVSGKDFKVTAIRTAIMTGVMLLVIAPWTVRNYREFGRFITISYNMGYVQLVNNNYANTRAGWMPLEAVPVPDELREQMEYAMRDGRSIKEAYELEPLLGEHARHWMVRNPVGFAQLAFLRVQRTFFNGVDDITRWAMNDFDFYSFGVSPVRNARHFYFAEGVFAVIINVFSAVGLLFCLLIIWPYVMDFFDLSYDRELTMAEGMVFIHIAFFVVIVAAFEGQERYNHPVIIFFIYAMIWLCSRDRGRNVY